MKTLMLLVATAGILVLAGCSNNDNSSTGTTGTDTNSAAGMNTNSPAMTGTNNP